MAKIKKVLAREILNSRGEPTVEAKVVLDDDYYGVSAAPSGVSISKYEAIEIHDNDVGRYLGLGVTQAVNSIGSIIGPKIKGVEASDQEQIDEILITLDGTDNKSKLGVNAILPVSQAVLAAAAASAHFPIWYYINQKFFPDIKPHIPIPLFNIINGGKHGAGNLDFQEFLIVPASSRVFADSLELGVEVYLSLKKTLATKQHIYSIGDEGGFAPNLYTNAAAFEILEEAISTTSFKIARDLFFGLDAAASHFQHDSLYVIKDRASPLNTSEFIDYYRDLMKRFHLLVLEDPLGEDDWDGWRSFTSQFGSQVIIVGDDLLATNSKRLETAISKAAANAILVKANQIGTMTETFKIIAQARRAGWKIIVSHRSGETNDTLVADLAVATGAEYVKFGAPARGERVAKYNRLSEIDLSLTGKPA